MSFAGLNPLAIVAAAAAAFVFGGLWYGVLSRQWMAAADIDAERVAASEKTILPYVITVLGLLLMAWVLAGIIGHLGQGQVTLRNGLISGAFIWLGFVVTTTVVNHTFQMQKRALTLIDCGHWLGVLLIQGAVIGWLGVG
ncbi:MAG: DUF1761 domain-containing protein [Hyphomicrobium sp.]